MEDKIQLYVSGQLYEGWKSARVDRSVEAVSGSFALDTGDKWNMNRDPLVIKPGYKCTVKINGTPVITGWVDSSSRSADGTSHSVSIAGRDVTCDLVDCSAVVTAFELHNISLAALAVMLCKPFGIKVQDRAGDNELFATVAIQPGESVWDCLDRQARQRDVSLITDGQGSLILCNLGSRSTVDKLIFGNNLKSASVNLDHTELFSSYTIKAQMPSTGDKSDGWNEAKNIVEGKATDVNVKRYRPLIITCEAQSYDKSAALRADREKRRRIGEAVEITAQVVGWTQSDGSLWPLGGIVTIEAPALGFSSSKFIIAAISNVIDDNGITTTLTLKHPDAFISDEKKKKDKKKKTEENYGQYWGD
ncbi:MAG: hypothetical protein RRY12_01285 [Cloacibacillus sp.]